MQVEVYVAFSIIGSFCFIRANKQIELANRPAKDSLLTIDDIKFKVSQPRLGSSFNNGVKLLSPELDNAYKNRQPAEAYEFFQNLGRKGWNLLDADAFAKKHNIQPEPVSAPAPVAPISEPAEAETPTTAIIEEPTILADMPDYIDVAMQAAEAPAQTQTSQQSVPNMKGIGGTQSRILDLLKQAGLPVNVTLIKENYNKHFYNHAKLAPADVKLALEGLVKRNAIAYDGTAVTALFV